MTTSLKLSPVFFLARSRLYASSDNWTGLVMIWIRAEAVYQYAVYVYIHSRLSGDRPARPVDGPRGPPAP
jgi:hypothetical protein